MAFDWISNLFQSEQTRGLSGGSKSAAVALDDSNPYYNYRLRRHKAEGDIVYDPGLLWYTSPYVKQRSGLGTHVAAEMGEDGIANFTDVLLILSKEDYDRATSQDGEPWLQTANKTLTQEFENLCRSEGYRLPHAARRMGFRVLCDGSADMGGQTLGLEAGDFVTGLLPNLYTGPVRGSTPVLAVHVNIPGAWDGYQEVGRLYNDQLLFTLGNHWLDNFSHPHLGEAALYRLQRYPSGSFVHIINPDLQDRYQVTSTQQGDASVLTLATRDGQPLAYMVLEVMDSAAEQADAPNREPDADEGPPSMAPPMLIDDDDSEELPRESTEARNAKTIVPDAPSERIFTLQERGALLQKVHFSAFMLGYDVYLSKRGDLGTVVEDTAAIFQVRKRSVSLVAEIDGVTVNGRPAPIGAEVPLEGNSEVVVNGQKLEYRDLSGGRADGWPYVGEIRRPASSTYMLWGETYKVGRSRECRVVLPDEVENDNINWKPSVGEGTHIRARTGEIPKSRFYTDSIMVASEHGEVDLAGGEPKVRCTARHCYTFVRRGGEVHALYPTTSGKEPLEMEIEPGDEVLIGNCLFHVGYSPVGEAVAPAPAPKVELQADSLVDAVSAPDFDADPATEEADVPMAAGLGEQGMAPVPVPIQEVGMDSILGQGIDIDSSSPPPPPEEEPTQTDIEVDESVKNASTVLEEDAEPWTEPGEEWSVTRAEGQQWDREGPPPPPSDEDGPPPPPSDEDGPPPPPSDEDGPPPPPSDEDEDAGPPPPPSDEDGPPPPPSDEDGPPPPPPSDEDEDAGPPPPPSDEDGPPPPPSDEDEDAGPPPPPSDEDGPPPPPSDEDEDAGPPPPPSDEDAGPPPPPSDEDEGGPPPPPSDDEDEDEDDAPPPPPSDDGAEDDEPADTPAEDSDAGDEPPPADDGWGKVAFVDDEDAQFELGRDVHLVHVGWMVNGTAVLGNHSKADLILPESRLMPEQELFPFDYFLLQVRGRRGFIEILAPEEVLVDGDVPAEDRYDDLEGITMDVIRRDDRGEEDFLVRIQFTRDRRLPDPRAQLMSIDYEDPLTAALLTKGLPTRTEREVALGEISMTLLYDGEKVKVSDFIESYRDGDGFKPFFVQRGGGRFKTAPEDGASFKLEPGDRMVVGQSVYVLRKE